MSASPPPPRSPRRPRDRRHAPRQARRPRRSRCPRTRSAMEPCFGISSSRRSSMITLASSRAMSARITSPSGFRAAPSRKTTLDTDPDSRRRSRTRFESQSGATIRRWTTLRNLPATMPRSAVRDFPRRGRLYPSVIRRPASQHASPCRALRRAGRRLPGAARARIGRAQPRGLDHGRPAADQRLRGQDRPPDGAVQAHRRRSPAGLGLLARSRARRRRRRRTPAGFDPSNPSDPRYNWAHARPDRAPAAAAAASS